MTKQAFFAVLVMTCLLAGCGSAGDAPPAAYNNMTEVDTGMTGGSQPSPQPTKPPHNYDDRDGQTYLYASAVSEEDQKKGKAVGTVSMFKYLGVKEGVHTIVSVDDAGRTQGRYQCSTPCRIIKSDFAGEIDRIPYSPRSVIGGAFEDALNGNLKPAKAPKADPELSPGGIAPIAAIPDEFLGEWNADLSDCGTGLNDSRLRIEPKRVRFYESDAAVQRVTVLGRRAIRVTASFVGEGQTWTDKIEFELSQAGDSLSSGDFTRYRCPG